MINSDHSPGNKHYALSTNEILNQSPIEFNKFMDCQLMLGPYTLQPKSRSSMLSNKGMEEERVQHNPIEQKQLLFYYP
uniref:Putative ovule protein n=1 Tax=Solanum chacoense TaxID=4108 RepID=A0A0V0H9A5_SOLCH